MAKTLTDAEVDAVRAFLATLSDPVAEEAKKVRRKAAWDAVDARQVKLRADAEGLDRKSAEYKALIAVGDPEVEALVDAARRI